MILPLFWVNVIEGESMYYFQTCMGFLGSSKPTHVHVFKRVFESVAVVFLFLNECISDSDITLMIRHKQTDCYTLNIFPDTVHRLFINKSSLPFYCKHY